MDEARRQEQFKAFVSEGGCLQEGDVQIRSLGRTAPYYFSTPRPMTGRQIAIIGSVGSSLLLERSTTVNLRLVGVANAGLPVAAAIAEALSTAGRSVDLLILEKGGAIDVGSSPTTQPKFTVLVDNAIITGKTRYEASRFLVAAGISIDCAISIFDHEIQELPQPQFLSTEFDRTKLLFLFSFRNLIRLSQQRGSARSTLYKGYARTYGTEGIRASELLNLVP